MTGVRELSPVARAVLDCIVANPGSQPAGVAVILHFDYSDVRRALDTLYHHRLIERRLDRSSVATRWRYWAVPS